MKELDLIEKKFDRFEQKLKRLMQLEQEFNVLDTEGFEAEVQSIRSKMKDPRALDQVASEIDSLKNSIKEREQWLTQGPGLFDTGKRLSKQGSELYDRGEYEKALDTFTKSMDKFHEAIAGSQYDPELTSSIQRNIMAAKKNISACNMGIGSSISETALEKYNAANLESAIEAYSKALPYFESASSIAGEIESKDAMQTAQSYIEKTKTNIENCYIALDKNKVEKLSKEANSLYSEAVEIKKKGELLEARDKFKEIEGIIDEAFELATKRDFKDAKMALSNILRNVRSELNSVYHIIAGGVEEVEVAKDSIKEIIIGAGPMIPMIGGLPAKPEQRNDMYKDYEILEEIGTGGFSDVYKANRKSDGQIVAVKMPRVPKGVTAPGKLFMDEAQLWSRLRHPRIVEILAYGSKPNPWLAIEYMEGGSLRRRIGGLSLQEAINIALEISDALYYSHHRGIIHMDIKPENVLFDKENNPKLSDWGTGKLMLELSPLAGFEATTPEYSSPEQLRPEEYGEVGCPWTDIYQYGAMIYEMITGILPFKGKSTLELTKNILEKEVQKPSDIKSDLPTELDEIVLKALSKRKEDRFEDISAMRVELNRVKSMLK